MLAYIVFCRGEKGDANRDLCVEVALRITRGDDNNNGEIIDKKGAVVEGQDSVTRKRGEEVGQRGLGSTTNNINKT